MTTISVRAGIEIGELSGEHQALIVESLAGDWNQVALLLGISPQQVMSTAVGANPSANDYTWVLMSMCSDRRIGEIFEALDTAQGAPSIDRIQCKLDEAKVNGKLGETKANEKLGETSVSIPMAPAAAPVAAAAVTSLDDDSPATVDSDDTENSDATDADEDSPEPDLDECPPDLPPGLRRWLRRLRQESTETREHSEKVDAEIVSLRALLNIAYHDIEIMREQQDKMATDLAKLRWPRSPPAAMSVASNTPALLPRSLTTASYVPLELKMSDLTPQSRRGLGLLISPYFETIASTVMPGRDLRSKCRNEVPDSHTITTATKEDLGHKLVDILYNHNCPVRPVVQSILDTATPAHMRKVLDAWMFNFTKGCEP